jgi:branched-chain amino acid transport system substrate-binding protein
MRRAKALVVLVALSATACAGGVGKERNAAPAPGAQSAPAAVPASGGDQGAAPAAVPAGDATAPAAPGATGAGTPAVASGSAGARSTTVVSGPAAALNRQIASAGASGPSGSPAGGGSTATGADSAAGPAGGGGTVPNTPAPLPGKGTTVGLTKDAVTLGLFYSKTGPYAGVLRNAPAIAQAAADEAGLINGRKLVLKFYDDGTSNASTIQVEEKRAKDEVFSLVSIVSESNVVLAPLADQHKIPVVIGNIDQKVAEQLTYAFPVYGYWARMATILPSFIKNTLGAGGKKIGIVYETTSTAIDAKNAFKPKAKELGESIVFEQPISQSQSTCANEVANLQSHGVELVYMMNGPLGAICMLRDAKALGYKPIWTGVGISWNFNVVAAASGGGAEGIRFLSTATTLETPAGRHYAELARKAAPNSGADTDDIMLIWYALVRSAIEGLRRAGPDLTRESLLHTWETRMSGYDSGYLPPPTFGPHNRSGPLAFGIAACCTNGEWTTPQQGWRATF